MATPADAPPAPAPSINTGDISNSVVVVGNGNKVEYYEAGAKVYKIDSAIVASRRLAPVVDLPQEPEGFVGRQKELSDLQAALQSSKKVSLWADVGVGKSALAGTLIYALHLGDASRSVAYVDALGRHGDDLLRDIYDKFYQRPAGYLPERSSIASDLQAAQAAIFVDNLDLSGNDISSLVNIAPACSFVLIAPKRAAPDGKSVRLSGLPDPDAVALFEEKLERSLSDEEKPVALQIAQLLKGIPDLIIKAANRCHDYDVTPAQMLADLHKVVTTDERSLAAFATANLSDDERKILGVLAAAGENPVPTADLKLAVRDINDVDDVLDHLKSLHLIQSHSPRFSLCGSLPSGLAAAWDLTSSRERLLQASISWLGGQSQASEPVEDSLPMMLHILNDAAARRKWPDVVRLGRLVERFVFHYTRWQAWVDVLNILLGAARATGDRALEAWALHQLGTRALAEGILDLARTFLNQSLKIRQAIKDQPGLEVTRHNLSLLKAAASSTHGRGPGKGGSGGHPLTYSFFGFVGFVVLAFAAYTVFRPRPVPPSPAPLLPPVITRTVTPTLTLTPTLTVTPTETSVDTETPTFTPSPTDTPPAQTPMDAVVIGVDFLACRYGPGSAYEYYGLVTLKAGDTVQVLGWAQTAVAQWAFIKYTPPYRTKVALLPCWVDPNYLKINGDMTSLPQVDPHAVFPIWNDPAFVPYKYPPPTITGTTNGNQLSVSVEGMDLVYIDPNHTDREGPDSPLFLVEFWSCQNGQMLLNPQGVYFKYDPSQPTASGTASATDDGSCGQTPYGSVWLAHRDGYIGPVRFTIP